MNPVTLAQQATDFLVPYLPFIYVGVTATANKTKEMFLGGGKAIAEKGVDMLLEKSIEKVSPELLDRAKSLLKILSPKANKSLEKALEKLSINFKDKNAKDELQQVILKLLIENPDLAREVEFTINVGSGNIDQFAVGNYNIFFNLNAPSGEEFIKIIEYLENRRKEEIIQESINLYNHSVLPHYPEKLKKFVAENRAEELAKALTYLENHRIILFSGVGGIGKSTLVRALVDLRPLNVPEPFWYDFNQNQDTKLGDILEKLTSYINTPLIDSFKEERREPGKIDVDRLTNELQIKDGIWLIFDDLSVILEDQRFTDKGIELLFTSLRYNKHNAKIIITSRILPILENGESLLDVVEGEEKQHLNGLETNFAIDYLARNGLNEVEPEKLKELARGVDGHPLALKLLVELVKEFGVKDILNDLSMYQNNKEDTIKKARKLFYKLAGEEKELLERISVYREPVSMKGLKEMFSENTPTNAIKKLIEKSLLETDRNGNYWLHPLVQEFAYKDLKYKKEVHMFAVKYYLSLPIPKNPTKKEDLQPIIEAHYHACETEKYNLAAQIILYSNLHIYLDKLGEYFTLITLYRRLLPSDPFSDKVLLSKKLSSSVLGAIGIIYFRLSDARKAINYHEKAMEIAKIIGDSQTIVNQLENLGIAYRNLDEPEKALEYFKQALEISANLNNREKNIDLFLDMAETYNYLDEPQVAIDYCNKALNFAIKNNDELITVVDLSPLANSYHDLSEIRRAIDSCSKTLNIAKYEYEPKIINFFGNAEEEYCDKEVKTVNFFETLGNFYYLEKPTINAEEEYCDKEVRVVNFFGILGNSYYMLEKPIIATECYNMALDIAIKIGYRRGEVNQNKNLGLIHDQLNDPITAIKHYDKALVIAKEIGYRRGEANLLRYLGETYKKLKKPTEAIEFLNKSLIIGRDIEDKKIIRFCEKRLEEIEKS